MGGCRRSRWWRNRRMGGRRKRVMGCLLCFVLESYFSFTLIVFAALLCFWSICYWFCLCSIFTLLLFNVAFPFSFGCWLWCWIAIAGNRCLRILLFWFSFCLCSRFRTLIKRLQTLSLFYYFVIFFIFFIGYFLCC